MSNISEKIKREVIMTVYPIFYSNFPDTDLVFICKTQEGAEKYVEQIMEEKNKPPLDGKYFWEEWVCEDVLPYEENEENIRWPA